MKRGRAPYTAKVIKNKKKGEKSGGR